MNEYHIIIKGRVQGVGYRWFSKQAAEELRIKGFVRNLPNGDVEVVAQGNPDQIEQFISTLREGPAFAHVTDVKVTLRNVKELFSSFDVLI